MAEIGQQLRDAREAQQLSLLEVERETRIRRVFLQAIEEERFDDLPGDVYTRGFIRNYALFLNLDPRPLLADFDHVRSAPRQHDAEVLDEPLLPPATNNTGARVFLFIMALLIVLMVAWYIYSRYSGGQSPTELLRSLGLSARQTAALTRAPSLTPEPSDTPGAESSLPATEPEATATVTTAPAITRTAFPTRTPTAIAGILVVVDVLEDSWAHIIVDQDVVFDGTLLSGEQHTWQAQSVLSLSLGNAGGISLQVNNVDLGILGEPGEVIELVYTPDTLPTPEP